MGLPKGETTRWRFLANTALSVFDTHTIKEKTMEENTKIEQPLNLDEEQLQAVTGATGGIDILRAGFHREANLQTTVSNLATRNGDHDIAAQAAQKAGNALNNINHLNNYD